MSAGEQALVDQQTAIKKGALDIQFTNLQANLDAEIAANGGALDEQSKAYQDYITKNEELLNQSVADRSGEPMIRKLKSRKMPQKGSTR